MKKCPRCMKTEEDDLTRFCKHCGTELFFLNRFPAKESTVSRKVNMKPVKIIVDILMLASLILSLLRWSGDPSFHIIVGSSFCFLFIVHFLLNLKMFISMTKKLGKLKLMMKLQYSVDVVLLIIWCIVTVAGIIAAINYLNAGSSVGGIGRLHGILGRVGCGFIGVHIIQHIKQILSYFKVKKVNNQ